MKKGLLVLLFIISLIFAVSCPDQHPILKMTEPVGENAQKTTDVDKELVISNVVLELLNDSFNAETVKKDADIYTWFVSSDRNKLDVKSAIITDVVADDSNAKDDSDIGKTTKVTLDLTVTPKKASGKVPVNVAVQVPKEYSAGESWTTSNKKISVLATDIQITIVGEEPSEDDDELNLVILTPSTKEAFSFKKDAKIADDAVVTFTLENATWKDSVNIGRDAFTPVLPEGIEVASSLDDAKATLTLTFSGTPTADLNTEALSYAFDASALIDYDKKVSKLPTSGLNGTVKIKIIASDAKQNVQFKYGKDYLGNQKDYFSYIQTVEIKEDYPFSVTLDGGTWKDDVLTAKYVNASSLTNPNLSLPKGIIETRELSDDRKTLIITFSGTPSEYTNKYVPYRILVTDFVSPDLDYEVENNKYIYFRLYVYEAKYIELKRTSTRYDKPWYDKTNTFELYKEDMQKYLQTARVNFQFEFSIEDNYGLWDLKKINDEYVSTDTSYSYYKVQTTPTLPTLFSVIGFDSNYANGQLRFELRIDYNKLLETEVSDETYTLDLTPYIKPAYKWAFIPNEGLKFNFKIIIHEGKESDTE